MKVKLLNIKSRCTPYTLKRTSGIHPYKGCLISRKCYLNVYIKEEDFDKIDDDMFKETRRFLNYFYEVFSGYRDKIFHNKLDLILALLDKRFMPDIIRKGEDFAVLDIESAEENIIFDILSDLEYDGVLKIYKKKRYIAPEKRERLRIYIKFDREKALEWIKRKIDDAFDEVKKEPCDILKRYYRYEHGIEYRKCKPKGLGGAIATLYKEEKKRCLYKSGRLIEDYFKCFTKGESEEYCGEIYIPYSENFITFIQRAPMSLLKRNYEDRVSKLHPHPLLSRARAHHINIIGMALSVKVGAGFKECLNKCPFTHRFPIIHLTPTTIYAGIIDRGRIGYVCDKDAFSDDNPCRCVLELLKCNNLISYFYYIRYAEDYTFPLRDTSYMEYYAEAMFSAIFYTNSLDLFTYETYMSTFIGIDSEIISLIRLGEKS